MLKEFDSKGGAYLPLFSSGLQKGVQRLHNRRKAYPFSRIRCLFLPFGSRFIQSHKRPAWNRRKGGRVSSLFHVSRHHFIGGGGGRGLRHSSSLPRDLWKASLPRRSKSRLKLLHQDILDERYSITPPMQTAATILVPLFKRAVPQEDIYQNRLRSELTLIDTFHFVRVFHQVQRIVALMEQLDIPHIIRGSSGSSLVCYLLGITEIDPIQHGLHLARFMNYGRTDIPDIDIDVPYNRRAELYQAISEAWPDQAARISNHVTYGRKTATREVATEVVRADETLGTHAKRKALTTLRRRNFKLDRVLPEEESRKEVEERARALVGQTRYDSLHCGGIVIFEEEGEVPDDLILKHETKSYMVQIRLDKDETEDAGFIKIDILSNRGLAQLRHAQEAGLGVRSLLSYPMEEEGVIRLFREGRTLGLTFGESRGMRKIFMAMAPRTLEEVAIALALIRPAAAGEGRKGEFLDQWKQRRQSSSEGGDPRLRPIIFDDDAIARIQLLLGCSAAEADRWRKAFAKGKREEIQRFRVKLYLRGTPKEVVSRTIDDLEQLVHYSFCKSHAISYAQLVWALAWEKVYHPHTFWLGTLNHCHSMYRRWVHWREARCAGLELPSERGDGPWTLEGARIVPVGQAGEGKGSVKKGPVQMKLSFGGALVPAAARATAVDEFRRLGYWRSKEFFPGCWYRSRAPSGGRTKAKERVEFRGLIATARILRREKHCTMITIGCDNELYVDLVLPGQARGDLLYYVAVEGEGTVWNDTVQVTKIRGVKLQEFEGAPESAYKIAPPAAKEDG